MVEMETKTVNDTAFPPTVENLPKERDSKTSTAWDRVSGSEGTSFVGQVSESSKILAWLSIVALDCLATAVLSVLWTSVGEVLPVAHVLTVLGTAMSPLDALLLMNIRFLYLLAGLSNVNIVVKALLYAVFYVIFGIHIGLTLTIISRFAPVKLKRVLSFIGEVPSMMLFKLLDRLFPVPVQTVAGIPFTLCTELLIIPCAGTILYAVAQMKYRGEVFDVSNKGKIASTTSREKGSKQSKVLVLIHGNRFNECQWLFGRILMQARGLNEKTEIITVNYFKGSTMRNHWESTETVEGCSKVVVSQILAQLKERGIEDMDQMILMGHSLGGVVSAYINEYLAKEHNLPVSKVIAWSAPFAGSDLLLWAKNQPYLNSTTANRLKIEREFCPTSKSMAALRERMSLNKSKYFALTGRCDPLVRPGSALLPFFDRENKVLIPYLGHYNIKVSLRAWYTVLEHLEQHLSI
eukprot:CAMPEP_0184022580 /NCGR_PEP_ID=MMETSP0954-20121128/10710_1 /TAXON_ID=627963 /ORGANISM="Aplanochytrium sp, Strain PBS07" /LENGTH=463 /DNA_ID=CAMNT_0026305021 /DNA_START=131 /DNA_END=1522 /DNA_ORIENTATION=+